MPGKDLVSRQADLGGAQTFDILPGQPARIRSGQGFGGSTTATGALRLTVPPLRTFLALLLALPRGIVRRGPGSGYCGEPRRPHWPARPLPARDS